MEEKGDHAKHLASWFSGDNAGSRPPHSASENPTASQPKPKPAKRRNNAGPKKNPSANNNAKWVPTKDSTSGAQQSAPQGGDIPSAQGGQPGSKKRPPYKARVKKTQEGGPLPTQVPSAPIATNVQGVNSNVNGNEGQTTTKPPKRRPRKKPAKKAQDGGTPATSATSGETPAVTPTTAAPRKPAPKQQSNKNLGTPKPGPKGGAPNNNNKATPPRTPGSNAPTPKVRKRKDRFKAHLDIALVREGLELGTLVQGTLRVNPHRPHKEAYVITDKYDRDILIVGIKNRNRAFNGDTVVVMVYEKTQWVAVNDKPAVEDELEEEDMEDDVEIITETLGELRITTDTTTPKAETEIRPTGEVVAILEAKHVDQVVGYLKPCDAGKSSDSSTMAFLIPLNRAVPKLLTSIRRPPCVQDLLYKNLFLAKICEWTPTSIYPKGRLIKDMGDAGNLQVLTSALLADAEVTWDENFSQEILNSLKFSQDWQIPAEELKKRRDLRNERIITIDPSTARDLDDAVSCKALGDGTYLIGVHIADVSFFVAPNTPLDREALKRATSIYLPHVCISMLPRVLCDNLCSLLPGKDRLALSVEWVMNENGDVLGKPTFYRSVIRTCARLDYTGAQAFIDGNTPVADTSDTFAAFPLNTVDPRSAYKLEDVAQDVLVLNRIAKALKARRFDKGSLTLNQPKLCFTLGPDGCPTGTYTYNLKASNYLIEELMLLANQTVAERLHSVFPTTCLLRCHPSPNPRLLAEFASLCMKNNVQMDVTSSKTLQESLEILRKGDSDRAAVIEHLATRVMCTAKYLAGDRDFSDYHHYALSFDLYTHFTSPIRRYADLIVHRLLVASINDQTEPIITTEEVDMICTQCNDRKSSADKLEQKCSLAFLAQLITNAPITTPLSALIVHVSDSAFKVMIPEYSVERKIHVADLKPQLSKWEWNKEAQRLTLYWNPSDTSETEKEQQGEVMVIELFGKVDVLLHVDTAKRPVEKPSIVLLYQTTAKRSAASSSDSKTTSKDAKPSNGKEEKAKKKRANRQRNRQNKQDNNNNGQKQPQQQQQQETQQKQKQKQNKQMPPTAAGGGAEKQAATNKPQRKRHHRPRKDKQQQQQQGGAPNNGNNQKQLHQVNINV